MGGQPVEQRSVADGDGDWSFVVEQKILAGGERRFLGVVAGKFTASWPSDDDGGVDAPAQAGGLMGMGRSLDAQRRGMQDDVLNDITTNCFVRLRKGSLKQARNLNSPEADQP